MKKELSILLAVVLTIILFGTTVIPIAAKVANPNNTSFDSALNKKTFNEAKNYGDQISTTAYTQSGSIVCMRFHPKRKAAYNVYSSFPSVPAVTNKVDTVGALYQKKGLLAFRTELVASSDDIKIDSRNIDINFRMELNLNPEDYYLLSRGFGNATGTYFCSAKQNIDVIRTPYYEDGAKHGYAWNKTSPKGVGDDLSTIMYITSDDLQGFYRLVELIILGDITPLLQEIAQNKNVERNMTIISDTISLAACMVPGASVAAQLMFTCAMAITNSEFGKYILTQPVQERVTLLNNLRLKLIEKCGGELDNSTKLYKFIKGAKIMFKESGDIIVDTYSLGSMNGGLGARGEWTKTYEIK